jgi:hypothetical protein
MEITSAHYEERVNGDRPRENFCDREINSIQNILHERNYYFVNEEYVPESRLMIDNGHSFAVVTKLTDEWFYVNTRELFYECDQFEELVSCLENILI